MSLKGNSKRIDNRIERQIQVLRASGCKVKNMIQGVLEEHFKESLTNRGALKRNNL